MTCSYCHREHAAGVLCRGVSRRAFFFFGVAAVVAAVAPAAAAPTLVRDSTGPVLWLGKGIWNALKQHPSIVDHVKWETTFAGVDIVVAEVPVDTGALRSQRHVYAALTELSVSYGAPAVPSGYGLKIEQSVDGRT